MVQSHPILFSILSCATIYKNVVMVNRLLNWYKHLLVDLKSLQVFLLLPLDVPLNNNTHILLWMTTLVKNKKIYSQVIAPVNRSKNFCPKWKKQTRKRWHILKCFSRKLYWIWTFYISDEWHTYIAMTPIRQVYNVNMEYSGHVWNCRFE